MLRHNSFILSVCMIWILNCCSTGKREETIGLSQNIHHDDFEYAVTNFTKANLLAYGNDTIKAAGNFYFVHFRVINKALRVNHQWNNSIGYLVDDKGNRYENNTKCQLILDKSSPFGWKEMYNTPHGNTDSIILVFDLPGNITQPHLMVRGDILMGDALDGGKFKRTKVRLF